MYESEVKDYCRRAGSLLACSRAQRQQFDRLTRQSVQEYLQEVPGAPWPEVERTLGSPEEAASAFMESLPPDTAEHWAGAHKCRLRLAAAAVCLVFALLVGVIAFFVITKGVAIIEKETTIYYLDDNSSMPPLPDLE
ncbi:hypothetical protein [uncultured Gemmiger sp.]|uniref:hypothetical protein n=1 Tax=uncultured Gemmiger sp. TaxID=1623490 RepID=UPI0025E2F248|nr:hypothetical protein [uncultured Gemmiger sp.]